MSRRTSNRNKTSGSSPTSPQSSGVLHRPWTACILAMLLATALRVMAATSIPALTYDGVYYLRQAMRILQGTYRFEGFPPGLPLLVAPFAALGLDPESVARVVNLVSGVASVGVLYWLARRHTGAATAFVLAALLAVHPVFVRVHVEVLSEPVYILAILTAFLLYERNRTTWCGLLLGYAFLVRPESLVLLPGLTLAHLFSHRRFPWGMLIVGLIPVTIFAALSSRELGAFVISAKQGQLDFTAAVWERLQTTFKTLHAVFPLVLVPVAVFEGIRRRSIYLWPLLYLAVLPFFDIHIQERLHLPAALFMTLLSAMWLTRQSTALRNVGLVVSMALLIWGTAGSAKSFFEDSIVLEHSRQIGAQLKPHLQFTDKVAGRFPFIPYYAGAGFVRIENLSYESIMDSIQAQGATHLLLMENEAVNVRPQLRDLFENDSFAGMESRLRLVQKVEQYPYERAVLYAFQTPPIPASVPTIHGDFLRATWFADEWLGIDRSGRLVSSPDSRAGATLVQSWDAYSKSTLSELCVSPDAARVALFENGGALHVYSRQHATWETFDMQEQAQPRSPCWVDERTILFVEGNGHVRALDTEERRFFDVGVTDIPDETPVLAVATRPDGGDVVAITYLRQTEDKPLERAIATAHWPESLPSTTRLELPLRWGTIVSLYDDRVAWVPDRDRLIISAAIPVFEAQERVGHLGRLSVIQEDGRTRRLCYHDPRTRAPQAMPLATIQTGAARFRLLYLGVDGCMQRLELPLEEAQIPEVTVLRDPQLRP